jgi:hypothetical protein
VCGACSTYGELRYTHTTFVGKPEGKKPLGRPRCRWKETCNIKIDIRIGSNRVLNMITLQTFVSRFLTQKTVWRNVTYRWIKFTSVCTVVSPDLTGKEDTGIRKILCNLVKEKRKVRKSHFHTTLFIRRAALCFTVERDEYTSVR